MAFRFAIASFCFLLLGTTADAQVVHRADVPAGYATPTGGTFSIRFPIPYSDLEKKG